MSTDERIAHAARATATREAVDRLRYALTDDGILLPDEAHDFAERHGPAIVAALSDLACPSADYPAESLFQPATCPDDCPCRDPGNPF